MSWTQFMRRVQGPGGEQRGSEGRGANNEISFTTNNFPSDPAPVFPLQRLRIGFRLIRSKPTILLQSLDQMFIVTFKR